MREQIASQRRDHSLGRDRQQVDLHEIEQRLNRKQPDQAERDPVEQFEVAANERRVEQMTDDLRERERDADAHQQADECGDESPACAAGFAAEAGRSGFGEGSRFAAG